MGRHSAPDDDGDDSPVVLSDPREPGSRPKPGRHSRSDDARPAPPPDGEGADGAGLDVLEHVLTADEVDGPPAGPDISSTARIEPIVDPVLDEPVPDAVTTLITPVEPDAEPGPEPLPEHAEPPASKGKVSDLALLRSDSSARARVIAAVLVPFVLYVLVLLVLDTFDVRTLLIWIWIPLVSAGVVAGLILDLAHKAAAARAIAAMEAEAPQGSS